MKMLNPSTPSRRLFVRFDVPGRPVAKQRVRMNTKTGNVFTPLKTINYEGLVALAAQDALLGQPPTLLAMEVHIDVRMPVPQSWAKGKQALARQGKIRPTGKPDLDNIAKILDGLNMVVWVDDSRIVDLSLSKYYDDRPGITVHVYTLGEA
jgi:Holliday junction resolvase RusA-like endonuclease